MTTPQLPAETPVVVDTPSDKTAPDTPINDGIIDLDADDAGEPPASDIEDGNLNTEDDPPAPKPEPELDPEKKKPSGAQRAKLEKQRLLDEIAARNREIENLRTAAPKKDAAPAKAGDPDPDMPKEEDFNGDYFKFTEARAAYVAAKAAREAAEGVLKGQQDREAATRQAETQRKLDLDHAERVEAVKEVITDFDTVMEGMKDVEVRDDLINEIKQSGNSAHITYHLAKNRAELDALNRMTPLQMAREIARLDATLKLPEPKKQTSAPPPLSDRNRGNSRSTPNQESILSNWLDKTYGKNRK